MRRVNAGFPVWRYLKLPSDRAFHLVAPQPRDGLSQLS